MSRNCEKSLKSCEREKARGRAVKFVWGMGIAFAFAGFGSANAYAAEYRVTEYENETGNIINFVNTYKNDTSEEHTIVFATNTQLNATITLPSDTTATFKMISDGAEKRSIYASHLAEGTRHIDVLGGTLKLGENFVVCGYNNINGGIYVGGSGSKLIIDGGNIEYCGNGHGGGIYVNNGGDVELLRGTIGNNVNTGDNRLGGGVFVGDNGSFTMRGGTMSRNSSTDGSAVYASGSNSRFVMEDGVISDNTGCGAVYASNSSVFEMTGGTIERNKGYAGGAFIGDAVFNMSGGTIRNNEADSYGHGGGIQLYGGEFNMSGTAAISENKSGNYGGGIYATNGSALTIDGGSINANTSSLGGGGIFTESGTLTFNGGSVSTNIAVSEGGGVYACLGTVITMDGGVITSNTTATIGGGIFLDGAELTMEDGEIIGNTAGASGGGVYLRAGVSDESGGVFTLNKGKVNRNGALGTGNYQGGGGIYINGGGFIMSGGEISENRASRNNAGEWSGSLDTNGGGGIYYNGSSTSHTVSITGGEITENSARAGGGILASSEGASIRTLNLDGVKISGNSADRGGGIFLNRNSTTLVLEGNTEVSDNTAGINVHGIGGGIALLSGTLTLTEAAITGNDALRKSADNGAHSQSGGGGIALLSSQSIDISGDVAISDNSAELGGGIALLSSGGANLTGLSAIIISDNSAEHGGGIYSTEASPSNITISNTNVSFSGNKASEYHILTDTSEISAYESAVPVYASMTRSVPSFDTERRRAAVTGTAGTESFVKLWNNYDISYSRGGAYSIGDSVYDTYTDGTHISSITEVPIRVKSGYTAGTTLRIKSMDYQGVLSQFYNLISGTHYTYDAESETYTIYASTLETAFPSTGGVHVITFNAVEAPVETDFTITNEASEFDHLIRAVYVNYKGEKHPLKNAEVTIENSEGIINTIETDTNGVTVSAFRLCRQTDYILTIEAEGFYYKNNFFRVLADSFLQSEVVVGKRTHSVLTELRLGKLPLGENKINDVSFALSGQDFNGDDISDASPSLFINKADYVPNSGGRSFIPVYLPNSEGNDYTLTAEITIDGTTYSGSTVFSVDALGQTTPPYVELRMIPAFVDLTVVVKREGGVPLNGASVTYVKASDPTDTDTQITDTYGEVEFQGLSTSESYSVTLQRTGFQTVEYPITEINVAGSAGVTEEFEMTAETYPVLLQATITEAFSFEGNSLTFSVSGTDEFGNMVSESESASSEGTHLFNLPYSITDYTVTVSGRINGLLYEGTADFRVNGTGTELLPEYAEVALTTNETIFTATVQSLSGTPLAGVEVGFLPIVYSVAEVRETTDENGQAKVTLTKGQNYNVSLDAYGFTESQAYTVTPADSEETNGTFTMDKLLEAVPVSVSIAGAPLLSPDGVAFSITDGTDLEGQTPSVAGQPSYMGNTYTFNLPYSAPGGYTLTAEKTDGGILYQGSVEFDVTDVPVVSLSLDMVSSGDMLLRVINEEGRPVANVSAVYTPINGGGQVEPVTTDSDGEALVEGVSFSKAYERVLSKRGYVSSSDTITASLSDDAILQRIMVSVSVNVSIANVPASDASGITFSISGSDIDGNTPMVSGSWAGSVYSFDIPYEESGGSFTLTAEILSDANTLSGSVSFSPSDAQSITGLELNIAAIVDFELMVTRTENSSDAPVEGATVTITSTGGAEIIDVTDDRGMYSVRLDAEEQYNLSITKLGYESVNRTINFTPGIVLHQESITMVKSIFSVPVALRLNGTQLLSVNGVVFELTGSDTDGITPDISGVFSLGSGIYTIELPASAQGTGYTFSARTELEGIELYGYTVFSVLEGGATSPQSVVLNLVQNGASPIPPGTETHVIMGKILDSDTLAGISDASIIFTSTESSKNYTQYSLPNGQYSFSAIPSGEYGISVSAGGYDTLTLDAVTISAGMTNLNFELKSQGQASYGLLFSSARYNIAAGMETAQNDVYVTVIPGGAEIINMSNTTLSDEAVFTLVSAADGATSYVIDSSYVQSLPESDHNIEISLDNGDTLYFTLGIYDIDGESIPLPSYEVTGIITDRSLNVLDANVSISSQGGDYFEAQSVHGVFQISGVSMGVYELTVNKEGYRSVTIPGIMAGGNDSRINIGEISLSRIKSNAIYPSSAVFDKSASSDIVIAALLNDGSSVVGIESGEPLVHGSDYTSNGDSFVLKSEWLTSLHAGTHSVVFVTDAGNSPVLSLSVISGDTSTNPSGPVNPPGNNNGGGSGGGVSVALKPETVQTEQSDSDSRITIRDSEGNEIGSLDLSEASIQNNRLIVRTVTESDSYNWRLSLGVLEELYARHSRGLLVFSMPNGIEYRLPFNAGANALGLSDYLERNEYASSGIMLDLNVSGLRGEEQRRADEVLRAAYPLGDAVSDFIQIDLSLYNGDKKLSFDNMSDFTKSAELVIRLNRYANAVFVNTRGGFGFTPHAISGGSALIKAAAGGVYAVLDNHVPINDTNGHWGENIIAEAANKGIIEPLEEGSFAPDATASSRDLFKMLGASLGDKYADGASQVFEGMLTRERLASILAEAARELGLADDTDKIDEIDLSSIFSDYNNMKDQYLRDFELVYSLDIMRGMGNGEFAPEQLTTRAQLATAVTNLLKSANMI